jgi:hypothetical protein
VDITIWRGFLGEERVKVLKLNPALDEKYQWEAGSRQIKC